MCSYIFQVPSKSVKGLRRYGVGGGVKNGPITLASGLYNSLYYRTNRDVQSKYWIQTRSLLSDTLR